MTPEQAKAWIPLLRAYSEGKTIQFKLEYDGWCDCGSPVFDEDPSLYRIKPTYYKNFSLPWEFLEEKWKYAVLNTRKNEIQGVTLCERQPILRPDGYWNSQGDCTFIPLKPKGENLTCHGSLARRDGKDTEVAS